MRYATRTILGLGLMAAALTVMAYALYQLLQVGTCASGGPYEIARECPSGTERLIIAFFPASLVLIGGAALYASRGPAPGADPSSPRMSAVLLLWIGLFTGLGAAALWGVWGPDANPGPGGELGGLIVGFLFLVMGLAPLLALPTMMRREPAKRHMGSEQAIAMMQAMGARIRRGGEVAGFEDSPAGVAPAAPTAGTGSRLERLERLDRLRQSGAVSQDEFERLKREIVE